MSANGDNVAILYINLILSVTAKTVNKGLGPCKRGVDQTSAKHTIACIQVADVAGKVDNESMACCV